MRGRTLAAVAALMAGTGRAAVSQNQGLPPQYDWGRVESFPDRGLTAGIAAGPIDSVWSVFKSLVAEYRIPLKVDDRATGQLGNRRFRAVRELAKTPLSQYLSCGTNMTGANADTYHVFIQFLVTLSPAAPDRTRFRIEIAAEAIDVPGGRSQRIPCATLGLLEYQIVDRLEQVFPGTK